MVGINIHKNIKLFYYTKNAILQLIPRWFFRNRLGDMMRPKSEDDIDYLKKRVDYYNRLNTESALPKEVKSLKELRRGKKNTTYFFDSYEVTRYFNPRLLVKFKFGDISQKDILKRCFYILDNENVEYDKKNVAKVLKHLGTDMRRIIQTIQKLTMEKDGKRVLIPFTSDEEKMLPTVASSLEIALEALDKDRDFLKEGGVFTDSTIDSYIELKMDDVQRLRQSTHPCEFEMYYSL